MVAELLTAIANCKGKSELNQVYDMVKEMKTPAHAVAEAVGDSVAMGFVIGAKVKMNGDEEIGEVKRYNLSTTGFYTGDRYPIIVEFERGTFEYGPDSLTLVK